MARRYLIINCDRKTRVPDGTDRQRGAKIMNLNLRSVKSMTVLVIILAMLALVGTVALAQSDGNAFVRFVHVIPGASAVDVFIDGQLTLSNLAVGEASGYITIPSGPHELTVTRTGLSTALWQQGINPPEGAEITLVAASTEPLNFLIFNDNLDPIQLGNARLTAINAIAGGPALDILLPNGNVAFGNLQFNQPFGTFDLPAFVLDMSINQAGSQDTLTTTGPLRLNSSISYMLVVYGAAENPQSLLLSAPTRTNSADTLVQILHAADGVEAVDVFLDEMLIAPALGFGDETGYFRLPNGDYNVTLNAAGSDETVGQTTLSLNGGLAFAAAINTEDGLAFNTFVDDLSGIDSNTPQLNFINLVDDKATASFTLENGTSLGDAIAFGEASGTVTIAPSVQTASLTVDIGGSSSSLDLPAQTLYGGVFYNVVALGSGDAPFPQVHFDAATIAHSIGSAPGVTNVAVAQAETATNSTEENTTTSDTDSQVVAAESDQVVAASAEVAQAQPAATEEPEAQVVPAPTEAQVVPAPTQPPAPQEDPLPTARIALDPGVNLQLRQFPSADALSLGLAPSGTILNVRGRAGAPIDQITGEELDPNFVDPATLLAENEDLVPAETWLNVDYLTPDGGVINAWINAEFVDVRDPDGERLRLADIVTLPSNQPGEARNTDITPPPVPEDRVTVVVTNLNPGVNLNLRRTRGTDGESIARLPLNTVLDFLGISGDGEWIFVRYTPPQGGTITGWVSANFAQLQLNGNNTNVENLDARGLLVITPDDARGELRQGAAPPPAPTVDPLANAIIAEVAIDPGANLHLRRNADPNSESLALIPSATRLVVTARTDDGEWLATTFEGLDGWIASGFVRLTLNNQAINIEDVPTADQ
ncbi:MAG: hypothetical protein CUN54_05090 [Phototrophicales bacterium]|nr:MAG: hypothetical protein CUN54_05090 [Phototrophicales bacterium]